MIKRTAGFLFLMLWVSASAYVGEDSAIQLKQQELEEVLRPSLGFVFSFMEEDNGIAFDQIGFEASLRLTPALPLRARYSGGTIEQDANAARGVPKTQFDWNAISLMIDEYQVTPQFILNGRYTYEDPDDGEVSGGEIGLMFKDEGNSKYKILARRDSFWSKRDNRGPRQYPRLVDLSVIPQDFTMDTVKGIIDWIPVHEHELHVEASLTDFEDGNELFSCYVHYQLPLPWGGTPDRWLVLRPNAYYESFSDEEPGYYSPEYHWTLGLGGHLVRKYEGGTVFELEVVPLWIFRQEDIPGEEDEYEYGLQGAVELTVPLGKVDIGVGGFGYYETDEYWLWHVAGKMMFNF